MHLCLSEMPSVWNHNCPVYSNSFCSYRIHNINKSIIVNAVLCNALIAKIHKYLQLHWCLYKIIHSYMKCLFLAIFLEMKLYFCFSFIIGSSIKSCQCSIMYLMNCFLNSLQLRPMVHEFTINNLLDQSLRKIAC